MLVTLMLLCLIVVAGAAFFGSRALEQAESQAQITAKGLANAGVASVIGPADVASSIDGAVARDLLSRLQRGVLSDGTAFRVRVWSPSGDLLFSTDAGDDADAVSTNLDAVDTATRGTGRINSVRTDDGEVFATFVPLRLGQSGSLGAVEVDQGYERIATGAESPWSMVRIVGIAGAAGAASLVVVASLPGAGSRSGGFLTPGREVALAKQRAALDERAIEAEARAAAAEHRAREIEDRSRDGASREREAEERATRAEAALQAADAEMTRLRTVADAAAAASAEAAETATRRLEQAEREVDDLRGRLRAADALAAVASRPDQESLARVESLELELGRKSEALERAAARADELEHRLAAAIADVEERAVAAEERAAAAQDRTAAAEDRVARTEARNAELTARLEGVAATGSNVDRLVAELEGELLTTRG
jgi:hypothetical protein